MLVDHHCHLDFPEFADDLTGVVARAKKAGVGTMVTISTRIRKFDKGWQQRGSASDRTRPLPQSDAEGSRDL